jgi:hypothetical protein
MTKQARNMPVLVTAALAAAACGGGHSSSGMAPPPITGPLTVGTLTDVSVAQDTKVGPVSVLVTEGVALQTSAFTLTATSSNPTLLPPGSVQVGTASGSQALTLTPADGAIGSAVITVTATDTKGQSAKQSFNVTFNAVYASFAALALGTFAELETATPVTVVGKTYLDDADDPSTFSALLQ